MRVLHVISGIAREQGGPTLALEGLAKAQRAVGLDARVLATWQMVEGRDGAEHFHKLGIPCSVYGPAHGKFSKFNGLKEIVEEHVADANVVHVHAMWEEIQHLAAVASRKLGKPYVWRACNAVSAPIMRKNYWLKRGVLAWRLKRDLNHAAAMHYTTANERDESAWLGLQSPVIVEPNGVDLSAPVGDAGRFRDQFPQLAGKRILLFVGRLNPEKGFEILIPAFKRVMRDDWMLVLVGSDPERPYRGAIELMMQEHAVPEDRVLFTGHLDGDAKADAYAAADLFVLPSRSENFGNVVLEAMNAGLSPIVTRGVGLSDEVTRLDPSLVADYSVEGLAAALSRRMTTSPARLSDQTRRAIVDRFDWLTIARRWAAHYQRIASAGPHPSPSR